jgi:DNA processing protein
MNFFTFKDKEYPKLLKKIGKDAPKKLYYKGIWNKEIFENCLAVVGSRQMTIYGKQVVDKIVFELAAAGLTIVSGFMYGIDATSHKVAVRTGGKTIAVMPCGIDLVHPEYQQDLYNEILENKGLIVSEYEGKTEPAYWTYPQRNRIVAGLSKAVLVVEAGERSGSLITANWAKKFNKKIFVIPGPITSENSKGIMKLIKEGATLIASAIDILNFYKIKKENIKKENNKEEIKEGLEKKIIEKLKKESLTTDELSRIFRISASEIGMILSLMQLRGLIQQQGVKYYFNDK